ncbi:tryptophan 7-halogenase [Massilia horti]|uniref:tryptophan 7-halogenase n=1 Tax=Massilia horti TaxID=2562153 RepID=UPI0027D9804B|nr:tryptophan 7-halogenase [Massilia horti]
MEIPDTLRQKMELFRTHGRIHRYNNELFTEVAWLQVMTGQNCTRRATTRWSTCRPRQGSRTTWRASLG